VEQGCSRDVNAASFTQRRDEKAFGHRLPEALTCRPALATSSTSGATQPRRSALRQGFSKRHWITPAERTARCLLRREI